MRSLENGKVTERLVTTSELVDFLPKRHISMERSDSVETRESGR